MKALQNCDGIQGAMDALFSVIKKSKLEKGKKLKILFWVPDVYNLNPIVFGKRMSRAALCQSHF
jgi:hypothetical protein